MSLENLPIIGSDHGPICLTLYQKDWTSPKPFRFEAMWLFHCDFKNLVKKAWTSQVDPNPLKNFSAKCGILTKLGIKKCLETCLAKLMLFKRKFFMCKHK